MARPRGPASGNHPRRGLGAIAGALTVLLLGCGDFSPSRDDPPEAQITSTPSPVRPAPRGSRMARTGLQLELSPIPCEGPPAYTASSSVPSWPLYERLSPVRDQGLQRLLESMAPQASASVAVVDTTGQRFASVGARRTWYAASLYKLPLLIEALWQEEQGLLEPSEGVLITDRYAAEDLGTLEPLGYQRCSEVTVGDAVTLMGVASDNAMAHLVRDLVGAENVTRHLGALGLQDTTVDGAALRTTAFDMALLLSALTRGYPSQFVSEGAQRILLDQWVRDRIPSGIDDPTAEVANKTGDWEGAAHDAAIVRSAIGSYSLVVLTDGSLPNEFFAEVARAVHEYLSVTSTATSTAAPEAGPAESP